MLVAWYLLISQLGINLKGSLSCSLQLLADSAFVSRAIGRNVRLNISHYGLSLFEVLATFFEFLNCR